ncbi:MAG: ATP-binding cassette domain-containing protein [Rhizobiaceae bacterium]|nr:ATP-binding cassette domain-containing protein [Rhizobiaceae bacterium]
MTHLQLKNLQFSYSGDNAASYQFDMKLPAGKILAIGGRSGAGKSTLLDLIAGFLKPTQGSIILDGVDITRLAPAKRHISILFQKNNLFEHLSVEANIGLGLNPNSQVNTAQVQQINEILGTIGLKGYAKRRANTLSGGQMQRVALARELLRDTKLILLDEPFNGLDDETRDIMQTLLKSAVNNAKRSIILISHDLPASDKISDLSGRIENGRFQFLSSAANSASYSSI